MTINEITNKIYLLLLIQIYHFIINFKILILSLTLTLQSNDKYRFEGNNAPFQSSILGRVYLSDQLDLLKSQKLHKAIKNKQFTQDANSIAENILIDDQGDYNAWYVKKMYLLAQPNKNDILPDQIFFLNQCMKSKVKGFQSWEQRRFLTENGGNIKDQFKITEKILVQTDQKNYHAWSYRVWLTNYSKQYDNQLVFANKMIQKDVFNNSAWSQLFFSLEKIVQSLKNQQEKKEIIERHISFALAKLYVNKYNRANWNFLRGLFPSIKVKNVPSTNKINKVLVDSFDSFPNILETCVEWWAENVSQLNKHSKEINLIIQKQLLATFVQIYSQKPETIQFAKNNCLQLKIKDVQRSYYWGWIHNNL